MRADDDFPGGNGLIEQVDGRIDVRPDLRDTIGTWFYWCFRVRDGAGRRIRVRVSGEPHTPIGPGGPAVSTDAGRSWRWLGNDALAGDEFVFDAPHDGDEIRFSFGMPYTASDLTAFLDRHADDPRLERRELTRSEHGRPVELLVLRSTAEEPHHRVLLTCRHHACEMMASHVLEGALDELLAVADPVTRWLASRVEFVVLPFVDVDGVEEGDQGKNRAPHDHGRDYAAEDGRYAAVRAVRDLVRATRFDVVLDLHCPNMTGPTSERIYFVGSPDMENWAAVQSLSRELERGAKGLPYHRANDLPFGTSWNVEGNYTARDGSDRPQQSIGLFLDGMSDVGTHAILEVPYASAEGVQVDTGSARAFGADLAHAIGRHLRTSMPMEARAE
ncbi:hypothetical protein L2X99_14425 [Microbacterium sp. KUDC0406]|uniref:M14 family zinc carboxypeptidase n=1 Tax=Microbacterium sp. KUDC0406 TaxID=2909588 RepID=UPI001F3C2238|nr:M14 family zinc carboxypeptidase [Microbacterium sp. KUDC0406]UJP09599.1 hypothetical protein L2X99_14425 [Microbacterium sp. KUDC0406]